MYYLPTIFLIFIVSCYSDSDFNSKARDFSIELFQSIGLRHSVICSYEVFSLMVSAVIWADDNTNNRLITSTIKDDYIRLKNTILDNGESGTDKIVFENFVFVDNSFYLFREFRETLTSFGAHFSNFNYYDNITSIANSANTVVNSVYQATNILYPDDFTNSTMIMANVMMFRSTWESAFKENNYTFEEVTSDEKKRKVVMIHTKTKIPFINLEQVKANVIELSLGLRGKYCMLIIKPHPGVKITETYKLLENVSLVDIMDKLRREVNEFGLKEVSLSLPAFKIESQVVLNKPLSDMGFDNIFRPENGHFPKLSRDDVYVSSVEHFANITFDFVGVRAYASTPGRISLKKPLSKLKAKEPFIFFVLEKSTDTVLFSGAYTREYLYTGQL